MLGTLSDNLGTITINAILGKIQCLQVGAVLQTLSNDLQLSDEILIPTLDYTHKICSSLLKVGRWNTVSDPYSSTLDLI